MGIHPKNKRRVVFYSTIVAILSGGAWFATSMPGRSYAGPLPTPNEARTTLAAELHGYVASLADGIGVRTMDDSDNLARASVAIEAAMRPHGYAVKRHPYDVAGRPADNLEATLEGGARATEVIVVGAHYDAAEGAPGADDNASGVAGAIALARMLRNDKLARTVRFVFFANEEPPHFARPTMGSLAYARMCQQRGDSIVAMLSLEAVGYYSDAAGSQKYPPPVSLFYPDRGMFLGFVGNTSSRALVRRAVGSFRAHASLPSEGAVLPEIVQGVDWSDHRSFWAIGVPAIMVTDTAPFRNPNYHRATDTTDTLDYPRFALAVEGLAGVLRDLAND